MMEDSLDDIRRAALDHAAKSGNLDDLEKAASVAKSLAEAEKSVSDRHNVYRQLRLQLVTSLSSALVPLVSLLALFATIYVQSQQLNETRQQNSAQLEANRQQNEDTQWRDLLTSLRGSADVFDSDVTVAPRLRSFFHSTRYGDQAKDISIRLMGRLTNAAGFKDLYGIVFAEMTPGVFLKILDIARSLNATRINIETECFNLSVQYKLPDQQFGLCNLALTVNNLTQAISAPFPERAIQLRQALSGVYVEITFLSQHIGTYLRANFAGKDDVNNNQLDLSGIALYYVDLSNVNLSNTNQQATIYQNVNLENADLRFNQTGGIVFLASNWWDARNIDQRLLDGLITYQYPFWRNDSFAPWPEPTVEHYRARIEKLCQPLRPACKAENLKFK